MGISSVQAAMARGMQQPAPTTGIQSPTPSALPAPLAGGPEGAGLDFGAILMQGIERANQDQLQAKAQTNKLVQTQGANLHETMVALSRADISLRLTLKVGQKLVQAYQEVSRMHI